MGMFKETVDALKAVVLLQNELSRLSSNVSRMAEHLDDLQQRIIRLESREEVLIARAEAAAQSAASLSRQNELGEIRERLVKIEMYLAAQAVAADPKLIIARREADPNP
jgi:phage shock protein A